jgi:hypothetical protein
VPSLVVLLSHVCRRQLGPACWVYALLVLLFHELIRAPSQLRVITWVEPFFQGCIQAFDVALWITPGVPIHDALQIVVADRTTILPLLVVIDVVLLLIINLSFVRPIAWSTLRHASFGFDIVFIS